MEGARHVIAAVYWGPRAASPAEAAALLAEAVATLGDAGYRGLRPKARSRRAAEAGSVLTDAASIAVWLERRSASRARSGASAELGHAFGLWSPGASPAEDFEFTGQVGSTSAFATNCFVLRLPTAGSLGAEQHRPAVLTLFHRLVALVRADQGVVADVHHLEWEDGCLSPRIPAWARHP
jgi:hypothetical protein